MSNSVLFFWCFAGLITGAALGFIYGVVWGKAHVTVYETQHRDDSVLEHPTATVPSKERLI